MTLPVYVWTMKDGNFHSTGLYVHLLLVDRYFVVGTQWPDAETTWYTKPYLNAEEARNSAVWHTGMLEKATGDTITLGPCAAMVHVNLDDFERLVERDVESLTLNYIFDEVVNVSVAP